MSFVATYVGLVTLVVMAIFGIGLLAYGLYRLWEERHNKATVRRAEIVACVVFWLIYMLVTC